MLALSVCLFVPTATRMSVYCHRRPYYRTAAPICIRSSSMSASAATGGSAIVRVTVLFFASSREAAGNVSQTTLELGGSNNDNDSKNVAPPTTQGLRQKLAILYPKLAPMVLDEDNLTLALNEEYVTAGQVLPLKEGDTVALIPPISGG